MRGAKAAAILALVLLAPSCGEEQAPQAGPDRNQIERLSTPGERGPPPGWSVRLEPLPPGTSEPCRFSAGDRVLLASDGVGGRVRQRGEERQLTLSAPIGPTGGFFEDRHLSISVGRVTPPETPTAGAPDQARLTVTNRRTGEEGRIGGTWTCEIGSSG